MSATRARNARECLPAWDSGLALKYERLFIDEIDDAVMLAKTAEDYRIEYNTIRPTMRWPGTGPRRVHLGLASPTIPTFQATETLPNS